MSKSVFDPQVCISFALARIYMVYVYEANIGSIQRIVVRSTTIMRRIWLLSSLVQSEGLAVMIYAINAL